MAYSSTRTGTRRPERTTRLVFVDAGPDAGAVMARSGTKEFVTAQPQVAFTDPEEAVRRMHERFPQRAIEEQRPAARYNLVQRADGQWVYHHDAARLGMFIEQPPAEETLWALLPRITCPALVVRGTESPILSPTTAERMVQAIPDCRLAQVADSAHSVQMENSAGFLAAVRPFLVEERPSVSPGRRTANLSSPRST